MEKNHPQHVDEKKKTSYTAEALTKTSEERKQNKENDDTTNNFENTIK